MRTEKLQFRTSLIIITYKMSKTSTFPTIKGAFDKQAHVAGAWTERQKMFHGGSFLKLADDDVQIENPEAQNRAIRGF